MYELNHAHKDSEFLSALSVIRYPGFSPKIHTIKILVIGEKKDFAYSDHRRMKNGRQRNACSNRRLAGQETGRETGRKIGQETGREIEQEIGSEV